MMDKVYHKVTLVTAQKKTSYSPWEAEDEKLKEFHVYSFAQLPKPSGWPH